MNVLIIPEDYRNDQFILEPLLGRLFRELIASTARVKICSDPNLGGIGEALKLERLRKIKKKYAPMVDLCILCVDRDGQAGRRKRLDEIKRALGPDFLAENAWEEVETWALAGLRLPKGWAWKEVRAEVHVKELWFDRLAQERGIEKDPGAGRRTIGREAARNIAAIRRKCPEDFGNLATRIENWISAR